MKKHYKSLLILLALIVLTFYYLFRNQDLQSLIPILKAVNPLYLALGLFTMVLSLTFEALGIWLLLNSLSRRFSFPKCLKYAFIGFFYCSITPTASGGPPMQVYYMKKDGAEMSSSLLVILIITVFYQIGTLLTACLLILLRRNLIMETIASLKYLVLFGILINVVLIATFISISFYKKLLDRLINGFVRLFSKLKIVKKPDALKQKIESQMEQYQSGIAYIKTHGVLLVFVLLSICFQILSRLSIPYIVYKCFGLAGHGYLDVLSLQSMLSLAVDSLPLPGAVGAAESSFLVINRIIFGGSLLFPAMLLSRGLNYYAMLIVTGCVALLAYFSSNKKDRPL